MVLGAKKRKMQLAMAMVCGGREIESQFAGAVTVGVLNVYAVRKIGILSVVLRGFT